MQTQSVRAANVLRSRDSRMRASRELVRTAIEMKRNHQRDEAIQTYRAAIELWPSEPDNYLSLAELLREKQQWQPALETLKTGLGYDPNSVPLHLGVAEVYLSLNQPHQSLLQTDRVLELERENPDCWRIRADAYFQLDQLDHSMAAAYQALAVRPEDEVVLSRLCQIYFRQHRPMRSWSIVQKMSAQYSDENRPAKLRLLEAQTLVQMNRNSDAIQTLKRWYQDGGASDPNCCVMLTQCLDRESLVQNGGAISEWGSANAPGALGQRIQPPSGLDPAGTPIAGYLDESNDLFDPKNSRTSFQWQPQVPFDGHRPKFRPLGSESLDWR